MIAHFRSELVSYQATMARRGSDSKRMSDAKKEDRKSVTKRADPKNACEPGWANGLKKLYDSVVEEPLPDSFKDLLSRLDDAGK